MAEYLLGKKTKIDKINNFQIYIKKFEYGDLSLICSFIFVLMNTISSEKTEQAELEGIHQNMPSTSVMCAYFKNTNRLYSRSLIGNVL